MTLQARRVGEEAASQVLAVVRAAFGARPVLDPPADALSEDEESIARALRAGGGILVSDADEVLGACLLDPTPDGLVLRRFGVVPGAQRRGVAGRMVELAAAAGLGLPALLVVAREELPRTIAFWEDRGFVEVRRDSPYVELARPLPTVHEVVDAEAMRDLGRRVGSGLAAGDVVVLTGELGAGKTTFTQGLGEGLGVRGAITSPTFVISRIHPSEVGGPALVHVDAYRLGGAAELDDLDLDASLDDAVTVVEWGAGLAETLASTRLHVVIERTLGDDTTPLGDGEGIDPRRVGLRREIAK